MNKQYPISMEISGRTAMWTRPDTGDTPVSYPAPTYAAVKGIFECVLLSDWAEVVPTKVEICKPIVYHSYVTNYGGPLRKSKVMKIGASYQLMASVLINVCYRLYATSRSEPKGYSKHGRPGMQLVGTTNGAHAYAEIFTRRLKRGQFFSMPCLGWKEFTPEYIGPFRADTEVCQSINIEIPSMLRTCSPFGKSSAWQPEFDRNVRIEGGVLLYAERSL
jgi:CRISPR-associated protein Cas5d